MTRRKSDHVALVRAAVIGLAATIALGVGTSPAPTGTSLAALSITKYVDKGSPSIVGELPIVRAVGRA
jgi:hypothetical protein